jgi:hypothetical protein
MLDVCLCVIYDLSCFSGLEVTTTKYFLQTLQKNCLTDFLFPFFMKS